MRANVSESGLSKCTFVEHREHGQVTVLSLGGENDLAVEVELRMAFDRACATNVQFLDSTGVGIVLSARKRLMAQDREVVMTEPIPRVWRVFESTGLDKVQPKFSSEDEVIEHLIGEPRQL
jgi:anti-anti-sigma factor